MGGRESQRLIVPSSQGNHPEGTLGREGDASYEPLEGNMIGTPRPATVFTKQQRIAELARNGPEMAFTTLAHHIDINWMHMAYAQTRKDGAVGVDGQTGSSGSDRFRIFSTGCSGSDRFAVLGVRAI